MTDVVMMPSPSWKAPARTKRGTDRMETIELKRLEMMRAILAYRAYVGPRALKTEVTRILEEAA
jgi:hypothetical protein